MEEEQDSEIQRNTKVKRRERKKYRREREIVWSVGGGGNNEKQLDKNEA